MSIAESIDEQARGWLKFSLRREEKRLEGRVDPDKLRGFARSRLASRMRQAPGTLENFERKRLKRIGLDLIDSIRNEFICDVEREIGRLEHELAIAREGYGDLDRLEAREIETHLATARALLARRKGGVNGRP
ncbi:hypothetical protein [Methylocystis parvus]|uniref:hypothetical protein n=1 Tax=Methylocystis parvus TaxID=134 RepID=UPI003C714D0F